MRTLILLRHAKSSWKDPMLDDHERPLNRRGRTSAPVIARWLADQGHLPSTVLCSSSVRTRETYRLMQEAVEELPEPELLPALYHATPETMLAVLRRLPDHADAIMLVGHEPGLSALAHLLDNGAAEPGCRRAFAHFPTAAAAVFRPDQPEWERLGPRGARFVAFATPRELMED